MGDDTSTRAIGASRVEEPVLAEVGLPLDELIRRGARDIPQRAIEAEVQVLLEQYEAVSLLDGRRAVVRNGYFPARAILTPVGPIQAWVPKVRDRSGSRVKFNSKLAPPYVRRRSGSGGRDQASH